MSSEKYEEVEDEFHLHLQELEELLNSKLPKLSGEPRKRELRNADKVIEDADSELAQMFDEAQKAPGAYRTTLMSRSRGFKAQLEKLRKEYNKASSVAIAATNGRSELFEDATSTQNQSEDRLRNRMAEGLACLDRGSESVARSQRIAAETDEVGVQIIGDLDDQRETLIRTKEKLKETDSDLSRSKRILNSMAIKLVTNKLLLIVIIVLELAILGAIVYLRFIKK